MPRKATNDELRALARSNPAAFATIILGKALPPLHEQLHVHRLKNPDCAGELARGHGKTTEYGIGELHGACKVAVHHPERPIPRLKVVVANDAEATKTGRFLRGICESDAMKWVFPELVPDDAWWNLTDFRLINRASTCSQPQRDPTVECRSIMGRPGGRWDRIWFDDICDLQTSILKPALRAQVKQSVENTWMPMRDVASAHVTTSLRTYTPWHIDDQGMAWRRQHEERGSLFRRPVIDFVSPWSEAFTTEYLRSVREEIGPIAFARAYELVPVSSDQLVFRPEWFLTRLYKSIPENIRATADRVMAMDFAFTEKTAQKSDPDWSVCHFALRDRNRRIWITETIRMQSDFPTFKRAVHDGIRRHGTRRGIGEAVAGQIGLVQQCAVDFGIPVQPITRTKDKHYRAVESQGQCEAGDLLLAQGSEPGTVRADQQPLFDELCAFPAGSKDDCVDPVCDLLNDARTAMVFDHPRPQAPRPAAPSWSLPGAGTGAFALPGSGVAW